MNPEWLRYYIAAKLNGNVEDIDFDPDDFKARINSDLVGKYINIASRTAPFLGTHFDGRLTPPEDEVSRDNIASLGAAEIEDDVVCGERRQLRVPHRARRAERAAEDDGRHDARCSSSARSTNAVAEPR